MSELIVYTKPGCPFCAIAKRYLRFTRQPYTEINAADTPGARDDLLRISGGTKVPVIVRDGKVVKSFALG